MISLFPPPVRRNRTSGVSVVFVISWMFMIGGIFSLAYAGYFLVEASTYQTIEIRRFEHSKPPVIPRILAEGDVIGEIQVPRVGVKAIVVQGDSRTVLRHAVGHLSQTALPGEPGNVTLAAHRDTFFRPLSRIQIGDVIMVDIPGHRFRYEVESTKVVSPNASGLLQASNEQSLTLITCYPFGYIGPAPNRFIVHAREVLPSP